MADKGDFEGEDIVSTNELPLSVKEKSSDEGEGEGEDKMDTPIQSAKGRDDANTRPTFLQSRMGATNCGLPSLRASSPQTPDMMDLNEDSVESEVHQDETSPFFRLPPELRNRIYEEVLLASSNPIQITPSFKPPALIMDTCRQIRSEAIGVYFGRHEFRFWTYQQNGKLHKAWMGAFGAYLGEDCVVFRRDPNVVYGRGRARMGPGGFVWWV